MTYSLKGRAAIITGANQGLGRAMAEAFVSAGASVLLCARNEALLDQVREDLTARAGDAQTVLAQPCDVSSEADVQRLVSTARAEFPDLQILVNNAGVYGPMGTIDEVDWESWVQAVRINLLGSVLVCRYVIPFFKAKRYGKVIQLSGGGATSPLPRISAYAASKAGIVRYAETLSEEVREHGIDVNAIAPGALNTRLLDEVLEAGPEKVGCAFYSRAVKQKDEGGAPLERAAALAVFLAAAESDGISGKLLSAIWDPWETLPDHRADIIGTDIYTLRRIIPNDRGLTWGDV